MSLPLASEFPAYSESDWQSAAEAALKGKPLSSLTTTSMHGYQTAPVYPPAGDAVRVDGQPRQGGDAAWDVIQRCDVPDLAKANAQALEDLAGGATGLALVLPGAVTAGPYGVPIASPDDLNRVLRDVELDLIGLRLDGGRLGRVVAPWLLELYQARNLDLSRCELNLGLDPIAAFARSGYMVARSDLVGRMAEIVGLADAAGHRGPVFVGDVRVYQEAGASPSQVVGLMAATLLETLRLLEQAGCAPCDAVRRIGVVVSATADQFAEICKMRALRLVWRRICEAMQLDAPPLRIDVETANRMISREDPHVNMLRTTSAVFGAGVGEADSITVLPFSTALGVPDGFARRMARNIQHILLEESGIGRVADPAAGSGYVEHLTGQLARQGWSELQSLERQGGMVAALAKGYVHSTIADMARTARRLVSERRIKLTGVSEFASLEQPRVTVWDMHLPDDWPETVERILPAHDPDTDLSCDRLVPHRLSHDFERLRDASGCYEGVHGETPKCVFLVKLGDPAEHSARASWVENLLAAGGIVTHGHELTAMSEDLGAAFKASGCPQACICSSDARYREMAGDVAAALKGAGATYVWLAGKPPGDETELRQHGVDGFMHDGANIVGILQSIHALSGVERPGRLTDD